MVKLKGRATENAVLVVASAQMCEEEARLVAYVVQSRLPLDEI